MKFQKKGFTSILLALAFVALSFSGVMLYASPKGRVAYWTNWTMCGASKEGWEAIHVNIAILFLIVSAFHLYFNWPIFLSYIKVKAERSLKLKKEIAVAVLITLLIILASPSNIPPLSTTMEINTGIQNYWEDKSPKAPAPHAEEFSVARLARTIDLPVDEVLDALRKEGFEVEDRFVKIREISEEYGMAPSDVYAALTKHFGMLKKSGCRGGKGGCSRKKQKNPK
ncbi:MAG: DUF4405 domain-containing protein [Pirellulales bacterium]|nr:DUF4405 domain-containing protein [Pirellulales bacterium]